MTGRLEAVKQKKRDKSKAQKKSNKWQSLLNAGSQKKADEFDVSATAIASVSEVWVDPFVLSEWDQGDVWDPGTSSYTPCYNYYTPTNFVTGNNYPTGCVATAMAQVVRYHSWPNTGIGQVTRTIEIIPDVGDPYTQQAVTRGGDGSGGAYNWAQMPYDPQSGVTPQQRQAIGALCYDAGVTVEMSYSSGGSSASLGDADEELVGTFKYTNSIYTQSFTSSGDARLWNILNANLDAQLPVILGIRRTGGGHAVVADGYGYTGGTLYHHINMGWGGSDNAWYDLPLIDASSPYIYTVIDDAVYNIYTSGNGEIISGRVTNLAGAPLTGVSVKAYTGITLRKEDVTNNRGVFALKNLSSNTIYRISAQKSGESFLDQNVTTGSSSDWGTPGNRSGILFVSAASGPPTAFDIEMDVDSTASVMIGLQALDDGEPDPNLLQYIITSLPSHGELSEPNVGPIDTIPHELAMGVSNVNYVPCPYFGGQDTFTYKANDGGTYPTGGDSNIAMVTVNVNYQVESTFAPQSTWIAGWPIEASWHDSRVEVIYLKNDIGQARNITGIALDINNGPEQTLNSWTIRMKHTSKANFSTTNYFDNSGWTTVYQANETISSSGWYWFDFDTPFAYDGNQNLMVDFSFNNSYYSSDGSCFVSDVGTERVIMSYSDSTNGNPLNWTTIQYGASAVPNCKFIGVAPVDPLAGDFDATCDVKFPDLAIFSQAWQTSSGNANYNVECDMTITKGTIDLQDLIIFAGQWLETYQ